MQRPNLARRPFLESRPVVVVGGALALVALVLSTVSVSEFVGVRGEERSLAERLKALQVRRSELAARVGALDRQLSRVSWRKLELEAASLQQVVVERKLMWSAMLGDLERVLPWDVRLVGISPRVDEDGKVTLAMVGVASSREAWLRLLARFFIDTHFVDPVPGAENYPGARGSDGYRFQLTVQYLPGGRS